VATNKRELQSRYYFLQRKNNGLNQMLSERVPSYFYFQSAVIPYRLENETLKLLLITNRKCKRWVFPKGVIETNMSPAESAEHEAFEEAGIKGHVYPTPIGDYQYPKWGGTCTVIVFLMEIVEILKEWPESEFRHRIWVSVEEAEKLVNESGLKETIRTLPSHIARIKNTSKK
jgi:phosphohistidine phosphatase